MQTLKTVGKSGQITLGKEFAGRHVLIEESGPGAWIIRLGQFIPDNEKWLHDPKVSRDLDRAIAWAEANPPRETDWDELEARINS